MVRFFIIYFVFIAFVVSGQGVRFEQITNESGRSLDWVTGMVQDSTGFMWLATRNGLYRYDGYSYKFFGSNRKDSTSILHNDLTYLYLDRDERLWMRHYKKLFAFADGKLTYPLAYFKNNTFDINAEILQDRFGDYWVGPVKENIIRVKKDGSVVDTFSMAHELVHPAIVDWLKQTKPKLLTDKVDTLHVEKEQYFMVASCGEVSYGSYYDYATITRNGEVIYDAREAFNPIAPNALFMLTNSIIKLVPGEYYVNFTADEGNSFRKEYKPLPKYGVGIYPVKKESEIAKLARLTYYPEKSIHAKQVKKLRINNQGYLTLLADNGIHIYKEDGWHSVPVDFENYLGFVMQSDTYNMPIIHGINGDYWVGCHKGLLQIDNGKVTEHILFDKRITLYSLMQDYDQNIWIATGEGLYKYDPQSRKTVHYKQNNKNRLYSNGIWDILEDRSHNMWIATKNGLNKLRSSKFKYDNLGMENYAPFPILEVGNNKYMTGGQSNELIYFSINNQDQKRFQVPDSIFPIDSYTGESSYDITDIMLVRNKLYLTYSNRIAVFNYPTLDLVRYVEIPNILVSGQDVDNHALYVIPSKEHIWVVSINGLYRYHDNLESDSVSLLFGNSFERVLDVDNRYVKDIEQWGEEYFLRTAGHIWKFSPHEARLKELAAFPESIYQTSLADGNCFLDKKQKKLWFSMLPEIYRMDIENYSIDTFRIKLDIDLGNCNTRIHDSLVWVSTSNGLIRFNPESQDFLVYNSSNGLADNNVNATYKDAHNNLWITGMKGLTKMELTEEKTETFFRSNDFIPLQFLEPHYRHPEFEHQLVLPTTTGYMRFNPDSLNPFMPPMVISAIYLFGKETHFDSLSYKKRHIELPFNKNFITFELASLDYTEPSKNIFRYKMENFNDQWIYTDANDRKAPYTGLPPGSYVFVAQGTNNDGVWGEPLRVSIIIHPPWYRTTTAYIGYVVFVILSIVLFIRYRERKLKEEKRILEQKVQERTAEISRQRDEIAAQKKDITDSIHYASRIQSALLPSDEFVSTLLTSYFILFKPRDIVSGDYYWLTQIQNQTIVVAADCTGHGVPGAFMSMLGVAFLNEIVVRDKTISANEILDRLREYVIKSLKQTGKEGGSKDGMDVALAIINHNTMEAEFSGAYNPLYVLRDNEIITIKADRMPIGYHIKVRTPFSKKTVGLQQGDRLYMFSDGYPDQFGGKDGRKFMSKRFKQELIDTGNLEMEDQKNALNKTIEEWKGDNYEQIDDILVIGLEI